MNRGLSVKLLQAFPDVVPVERPEVSLPVTIHPEWLAGFTSAEGCFLINIIVSPKHSVGNIVRLVCQLTQHVRDKPLMELIKYILGCGNLSKNGEAVDIRVTKISDIDKKIIPFFKKFQIRGVKALDFEDWCIAAELIREKKHLTPDGLELIEKIKAGMNTGRKI